MASLFAGFCGVFSTLTHRRFQSVGTVKRHAASSQVLNELAAAAYAGVEVLKDSQTLVVSEFLR